MIFCNDKNYKKNKIKQGCTDRMGGQGFVIVPKKT
jgi:hypothetical protein